MMNNYVILRNTPGSTSTKVVTGVYKGTSAKDAWERFLVDKTGIGFESLIQTYREYANSVFIVGRRGGAHADQIQTIDIHVTRVKEVTTPRWESVEI